MAAARRTPTVYIDKWLIGYSLLLGAVGGVLIADYFVIRRTQLDQAGLYKKDGPYWYSGGFNPAGASSRWCSASRLAFPAFWPPWFLALQGDPNAPPICEIPTSSAHLQLRLVHQLRRVVC